MGLILNGNAPNKILYNGAEVSLYFNGSKIWPAGDPYNPLNLPPNTVRVRTNDGNVPVKGQYTLYDTATLVAGTTDVYDVYKSGTSFRNLLIQSTNVVEILGANTTDITNMDTMFSNCPSLTSIQLFDTSKVITMDSMFASCTSLTRVPLFDTSNVTRMNSTFDRCTSLTSVPLFNTSKVTNMAYMLDSCTSLTSIPLFNTSKATTMTYMFNNCTNVQSGALALYQQASTQTTPPSSHIKTFYNCGSNTTTGAAELAQISSDWK